MTTCKVCHYHFHEARLHCPTCGAFTIPQVGTYDIANMQRLVIAQGVQRQDYARTRVLRTESCDCEE